MESMVSLEQIEELAAQLPQQEQLKLVARICKRLIEAVPKTVTDSKKEAEMLRRERAREATAILHECLSYPMG